jgi:hypothetical protein
VLAFRSPMIRAVLIVCLVAVGVFQTARASAAAFDVNDTSWEGTSELLAATRAELGASRVLVLGELDWSLLEPNDAILLLHPEHVLGADKLAAFLDRGGRAAILDDYGSGDRILAHFQIERVPAPARPLMTLRNKAELAIADPVREAGPLHAQALHMTVQDVDRLVTNHPTGLRNEKMTPVLRIRSAGSSEPDVLLALAGNFGTPARGKLFAMGDPSALTNQMLRYPGNRAFATGLVRYLAQDPTEAGRGGRLLILSNRFSERGSFAGVTGLSSEISSRLETLSEEFERLVQNGLSGAVGWALAALLALGIGLWTTSVASRSYRPRTPSFARPLPLLAQGGLAGRAALLAQPGTPLSLSALELKSAIEEQLARELGFRERLSEAALLEQVSAQRALDANGQKRLQALLLQLSRVETLVVARQPIGLTRRDIVDIWQRGEDLVDAVRRAVKGRAAA